MKGALNNILHVMCILRKKIRKMEYEHQLLEGIYRHLQTQLAASNEKVARLTETTTYLRREKEIAEEEILSTKIKQNRIKGANTPTNGCISIKRDLEQMKRAFLASEEIIENKNKEIAGKDALVQEILIKSNVQLRYSFSFFPIRYEIIKNIAQRRSNILIKSLAQTTTFKASKPKENN